MIMPDVNLLMYAYNSLDPQHRAARSWWETALSGTETIGLPWVVMSGFIRLMTHPRVLSDPMPVRRAADCVRLWLEQPGVVVVHAGHRFPSIFLGFLETLGTGGNLTTDAHLAALAVEHQAELHSSDGDFFRFPGLRWRNPLKGA